MNFLSLYFLPFLLAYKYFALFFIVFVAAFIFPLPSTWSLIISGGLAAHQYMNIYVVIGIGLLGNILGDNLGYFLGRLYGRRFLYQIGLGWIFRKKWFQDLQQDFKNHVRKSIFISRFITEIGPAVNLLSGLRKIEYRKFLFYEVLGETSDVLLYVLGGYLFGRVWIYIYPYFGEFLIAVVLIWVFFLIYRRRKKTRLS
ncbi:MAG TPA: DedA family protein [Candidatus Paceibacterota bacterium]|nr:DedA family protein [Candidatus Paceibacterota bacterium]